jgi:type I restriction-modification system DNA methylase subunit
MAVTEDGITDLMADYLRDNDIGTVTQVSISTSGTRSQPDFQVKNGGKFVGEAKWEDQKWEGFGEARDYSHLPGVSGSFLIAYPEELKQEATQTRIGDDPATSILSGHKYSVAFLRRDAETDIATLELDEIPGWIESNIQRRREPQTDPEQVVDVLRQTAYELNEELQTAPEENLFRNVLGATPEEGEEREAARETAGFLLVNQITFYRVLSANKDFPDINIEGLATPDDLGKYFESVLEEDYTPVYSFRIANDLPQESLTILKDAVKSIYALSPERINHDVLGKVFHELIPVSARKKVAAYYTKSQAADILANLAIDDPGATVMDPACGSGTLLAAAYMGKRELIGNFTEKDHRRFVEDEITGIDVMPFAAHLSCIHLALQEPVYETDEVNIGIEDSTRLSPGKTIDQLSFVLPESSRQRGLDDFSEESLTVSEEETVESGSIAMDAASGRKMELDTVDVVMMNPPYSRQESIARFDEGYKSGLHNQFSRRESKGQLHGKMSFCSYFMFLADKFLDQGGRIAAVLPASILNKTSDTGVREMLMEEYSLEHIVVREDQPNLSEDTDFREILLVAKKGQPEEGDAACYIGLNGLNINTDDLLSTVETAKGEGVDPSKAYTGGGGQYSEFTIHRLPLTQLTTHNLFSPVAVQNFELFDVWNNIREHDYLSFVEDLDTGLTGGSGGGIPYWNEGVLNAPHDYLRKDDVWVVDRAEDGIVEATHKYTKQDIEIPPSALEPYFHRYAHRAAIDVSGLNEYSVVREFNDLNRFLQIADVPEIPDGWEGHVERRKAHLGVPDRCDFTAPGTRLLAYYSDEPRMYHRMWMFPDLDKDTAKGYAVWLNSSLGILQFLLQRIPYRGGWGKYHRHTLAKFNAPDPNLSQANFEHLTDTFENVSTVEFPSLIEQLVRNADPGNMSEIEKNRIDLQFEDMRQNLEEGFEPRRQIDEAVLDLFKFEESQREQVLERLYPALINEIIELKQIM